MLGLTAAVATTAFLALAAPAGATPSVGPCEEIVYVGQCEPVGGQSGPAVQHPYGEFAVTPDSGAGGGLAAVTGSIG